MVAPASIRDGLSNMLLIGEKFCRADNYEGTIGDAADDSCAYGGHDWDICRWVATGSNGVSPIQDVQGYFNAFAFGSAHSGGFQTALCDGSVRMLYYDVDLTAFQQLGKCDDGAALDTAKLGW
jgi:hypothetical protein